ncbi:RNA polymerase sigma factor [Oceanobacillus luteolus]|uniref:RNA polymerase sigma factor n=1 Tax=Oceanobacillus luteolus TaxID=1274358 RepID=A0ABW4HTL8_9BACI|nr:RNA polymerase sigma factor [Oceanobacillus luteolus]MCM3741435.1 RNA polymerase sigma factor [Oceanobacillus luteolus]
MPDQTKEEITDWYHLYSESIFKYILMMIHDYQMAEDLTHDTFIKAYKNHHTFQHKAQPKTWLFSIAHNLTIDYIRKQKPLRILQEIFTAKKTSVPSPDDIVEIRESSIQLYRALSKLKSSYREVIILRKIKEFSIRETSEILNWSEGKVKTTLYRAIPALEKELLKEGYPHEKSI